MGEKDVLLGFFVFVFWRQGFSVALESVLELALVDQADLKLTEIHLPLPPECWVSFLLICLIF